MLVSIVVAVIVLAVLIIVHEAGHFAVAKRLGVRVIRFSIGYPPKIWGIRRGETEYAIGATPFGGYVRMLGDEVSDESGSEDLHGYLNEIALDLIESLKAADSARSAYSAESVELRDLLTSAARNYGTAPDSRAADELALREFGHSLKPEETFLLESLSHHDSLDDAIKALCEKRPEKLVRRFRERAFPNQRLAKRFAIVLAGPLANLLFAPLLLAVVYIHGVPYLKPVLGPIEPKMPAAVAGLMTGDRIITIDGKPIANWDELSKTIKASNGEALKFEVERPGKTGKTRLTLEITPKRQEQKTALGGESEPWVIGVLPSGDEGTEKVGLLDALPKAIVETGHLISSLVMGIVQIIDGATPVRQALGGPIMIAQMAGHEAHQGFANLAMFVVLLSLELGIINLLPVPMLDGGHLLFFIVEGIRGKPLKLRHREIALQLGLILLVALMAFVIFNDIARIVHS